MLVFVRLSIAIIFNGKEKCKRFFKKYDKKQTDYLFLTSLNGLFDFR